MLSRDFTPAAPAAPTSSPQTPHALGATNPAAYLSVVNLRRGTAGATNSRLRRRLPQRLRGATPAGSAEFFNGVLDNVTIETNVPVPEPTTIALLAAAALPLLKRRRK